MVLHLPDAPVASVLVCPSILTDLVSNYQRETRLSRALAADGIAVARFHYRGTGHSEGDPLAATFETMVRDAADALAHLAAHATTDSVGFVGSRWPPE